MGLKRRKRKNKEKRICENIDTLNCNAYLLVEHSSSANSRLAEIMTSLNSYVLTCGVLQPCTPLLHWHWEQKLKMNTVSSLLCTRNCSTSSLQTYFEVLFPNKEVMSHVYDM